MHDNLKPFQQIVDGNQFAFLAKVGDEIRAVPKSWVFVPPPEDEGLDEVPVAAPIVASEPVLVDLFSASVVVQIVSALSEENQAKILSFTPEKIVSMSYKLMAKMKEAA